MWLPRLQEDAMSATKNSISRIIDRYENLNNQEVRILLEYLLHHWNCDSRRTFAMSHPVIAAKLNPGCIDPAMAIEISNIITGEPQD